MEDIKTNQKMITFRVHSHPYFQKNHFWFVLVYIVLLLLGALYFWLKQYTGIMVILAIGIIVYFYSTLPPQELACSISPEGIKIGEKMYRFLLFKHFWSVETPSYLLLYLERVEKLKTFICLLIPKNQPFLPIKKILLTYLPEKDTKQESFPDKLLRILKF